MKIHEIETNLSLLSSKGVSDTQIKVLAEHILGGYAYVSRQDLGSHEAIDWFEESLKTNLPESYAKVMHDVVMKNYVDNGVEYLESGYDSNQSHRNLAKVAGEAILLAGIKNEFEMCGFAPSFEDVLEVCGSKMKMESTELSAMQEIAIRFGANQDFLFPGVTATEEDTPSLEKFALAALMGNPIICVRSLFGLGGLRKDNEWNHVTDIVQFAKLKVTEDKRYYPGLGIFYIFSNLKNLEEMPIAKKIKEKNPVGYEILEEIFQKIHQVKDNDYSGVSILCSQYLPSHKEMKNWEFEAGSSSYDFASAFHSPAYEFGTLARLFEQVVEGKNDGAKLSKKIIEEGTGKIWSFNSTIHLPWTSEIAGLSNNLMGQVTNSNGEYAVRYGVGYKGKSLEVREYHYKGGLVSYALYYYPQSDTFNGVGREESVLDQGGSIWKQISKIGFMEFALKYLEEK